MSLEYIDVLDSAVKIGLGAAIGAYAAYKSTKLNHLNEKNKDLRIHRLKTIELIAENCDQFFGLYSNYKNRLGGILVKHAIDEEFPLTEAIKDRLKEVDEKLFSAVESANVALSRLSLLRADKAKEEIEKIIGSISDVRNRIMLEKTLPSKVNFAKFRAEMTQSIRRFQDELATIYENIS